MVGRTIYAGRPDLRAQHAAQLSAVKNARRRAKYAAEKKAGQPSQSTVSNLNQPSLTSPVRRIEPTETTVLLEEEEEEEEEEEAIQAGLNVEGPSSEGAPFIINTTNLGRPDLTHQAHASQSIAPSPRGEDFVRPDKISPPPDSATNFIRPDKINEPLPVIIDPSEADEGAFNDADTYATRTPIGHVANQPLRSIALRTKAAARPLSPLQAEHSTRSTRSTRSTCSTRSLRTSSQQTVVQSNQPSVLSTSFDPEDATNSASRLREAPTTGIRRSCSPSHSPAITVGRHNDTSNNARLQQAPALEGEDSADEGPTDWGQQGHTRQAAGSAGTQRQPLSLRQLNPRRAHRLDPEQDDPGVELTDLIAADFTETSYTGFAFEDGTFESPEESSDEDAPDLWSIDSHHRAIQAFQRSFGEVFAHCYQGEEPSAATSESSRSTTSEAMRAQPARRGPGRPRKEPPRPASVVTASHTVAIETEQTQPARRGRGRPRKVAPQPEQQGGLSPTVPQTEEAASVQPSIEHDLPEESLTYFVELWRDKLEVQDILDIKSRESHDPKQSLTRRPNAYEYHWEEVLAGGKNSASPPRLNIEKSSLADTDYKTERTWDVDAFLVPLKTLGAFRKGLDVFFYPRFSKMITQDLHVKIHGFDLRNCKHIRLGRGLETPKWDLYIVFPNLSRNPKPKIAHLTDKEQNTWITEILLPSVYTVYPRHVLQHCPRSFNDARLKARSKQFESSSLVNRYLVESSMYLSDSDEDGNTSMLEDLWNEVQYRLSTASNNLLPFKGAFLINLTFDCKLQYRYNSLSALQNAVTMSLQNMFRLEHIYEDKTWVDIAVEDTPSDTSQSITLLRRSCCNWGDIRGHRLNTAQVFRWMGTAQASSIRTSPSTGHELRQGGCAYMQSYNLIKDLFTTLDKDHIPLASEDFRALSFSNKTLKDMYETNFVGSSYRIDRGRILKAYRNQLARLNEAISAAANVSFGVRREWRITLHLFNHLELRTPTADVRRSQIHHPFFAVYTRDALEFTRWQVNRWLYPAEVLINAVNDAPSLAAIDRDTEIANSPMLTALLDSAQLCVNSGCIVLLNRLAKRKYSVHGIDRFGLDFESSIRRNGLVWLPNHASDPLFSWSTPSFQPDKVLDTAFPMNRLRDKLRQHQRFKVQTVIDNLLKQLGTALAEEYKDMEGTVSIKDPGINRVLVGFDWLISREYTASILGDLTKNGYLKNLPIGCAYFQGFAGLHYDLVTLWEGCLPALAIPTGAKRVHTTKLTPSDFKLTFHARLRLIFDWDDGMERKWENARFRTLARRCHAMIKSNSNDELAEAWRKSIGRRCKRFIRILPTFESTKLWRPQKASPNISDFEREYRKAGNAKIVWLAAKPYSKDSVEDWNTYFLVASKQDADRAESINWCDAPKYLGIYEAGFALYNPVIDPFTDLGTPSGAPEYWAKLRRQVLKKQKSG